MDSTCRTKTVQSLTSDISKDYIVFSHKLQREEGQWSPKTKSDLIDSLLRRYPINPTYAVKEGNILSVIDGVQRLSTLRDYISNSFRLSKDLEPVMIRGEEKIIAGKKFNKLDKDVQEALLNSELQIYELSDYTEKDIREMFRRQNAGKSLNKSQLRTSIENEEMSEIVCNMASLPFFEETMSKSQKKKSLDKDIIRQTLMLIETDKDHDYTSFRDKDINAFIAMYQENINYDRVKVLEQALDKLYENLPEFRVTSSSLPMIIYSAYRCIKDKKSFVKLIDAIHKFVDTYDKNEVYKQYCVQGTNNAENVRGRLQYWKDVVRKL